MSTLHTILASLPSFCQKLSKLVEIWRNSDKKKFAQFFSETRCRYELILAIFDLTEFRFSFIVNPNVDSLANRMVWICVCCRKWWHCYLFTFVILLFSSGFASKSTSKLDLQIWIRIHTREHWMERSTESNLNPDSDIGKLNAALMQPLSLRCVESVVHPVSSRLERGCLTDPQTDCDLSLAEHRLASGQYSSDHLPKNTTTKSPCSKNTFKWNTQIHQHCAKGNEWVGFNVPLNTL